MMRSLNRTLPLLAVVVLLITASRLPAPIQEIPEPTSAPKSQQPKSSSKAPARKSAPAAETGMNSRSVQVVLTENTRAAILYLKNYVQTYESMPFAGKSDVRPDEILEQLRQALSTRFSNVSILSGGSSSRSGGLTMLLDLQAHVGSISFTSNTVSFIATFKNSAGRTIQTISASGKSTIPYPAFGTQFPKAVSRAFADFSQKLSAAR
jgi:hypothetical protein